MRLSYKDNNGTLEIIDEIDKVDSPNTTKYFILVRQNNYYPFGLKHKGYNTNITSTNIALKRKFGGKEYQDELGLDWYDITARNYDPALGRWMNVDPLAEMMRRHSPYNYAFNNPIFFIDPDGLSPCPTGDCVEGFDEIDSNSGSDVVTGDNVANELDEVVVVAKVKQQPQEVYPVIWGAEGNTGYNGLSGSRQGNEKTNSLDFDEISPPGLIRGDRIDKIFQIIEKWVKTIISIVSPRKPSDETKDLSDKAVEEDTSNNTITNDDQSVSKNIRKMSIVAEYTKVILDSNGNITTTKRKDTLIEDTKEKIIKAQAVSNYRLGKKLDSIRNNQ